MHDRAFHAEEVGVEVPLGDAVTNLPGETGVELVLGHGVETRAAVVGCGILGIEGHVQRLRGDRHFIDALPRPFEIRAARGNDAHLRIDIALALLGVERFGDGIVERGLRTETFGAAEDGLHGALVLIDRVKAGEEVAREKPGDESEEDSEESAHKKRWLRDYP